jgi:hypothetical protein
LSEKTLDLWRSENYLLIIISHRQSEFKNGGAGKEGSRGPSKAGLSGAVGSGPRMGFTGFDIGKDSHGDSK